MFKRWLADNRVEDYSFDGQLFPDAGDRTFWEPATTSAMVTAAQEYLGYEWPLIRATHYMELKKSGSRLAQETPHFARRTALTALVLGELAEYKGRFLPDIVDGVFAVCEETFWGLSAHAAPTKVGRNIPDESDQYIDLYAAETAELLVVIRHLFYDKLRDFCPELLHRIEYELDRRIVTPYLTHADYWWMGYRGGVNNWNPWILSNVLTVFLMGNVRRSQLEVGLRKMLTEINVYYDGMPQDGGCDEGPVYWSVAGAKLFAFCDLLYRATEGKINFFKDEKLCRIGRYELKAYIGNCYFVNFADAAPRMTNRWMDYPLYGFGLRTDDAAMRRFAATLKREQKRTTAMGAVRGGGGIKALLFALIYAADIDAQPDFVPEEQYVLPDIQVAFVRQGKWYCAAKGGHNKESHNHNDVGSFMVYYDAAPVLVDPGCGVYTKQTFSWQRYEIWTMQSQWHNLPTVNGKCQHDGAQYKADAFAVENKTATVRFAAAYENGSGLTDLTRTVSIADEGVTVRDAFAFDRDDNTVTENFMTPLSVEVKDNAVVIGGKFVLTADRPTQIAVDHRDFDGDANLIAAWGPDGLNRITFTVAAGTEAQIEFKLRCLE